MNQNTSRMEENSGEKTQNVCVSIANHLESVIFIPARLAAGPEITVEVHISTKIKSK